MFQNLKTRVGNMAAALKKYNPLLIELVSREIKVRYRKSVLGMLWTVLNPLLMMCVITVVFSTIFKQNIPNFPIYYLSGSLIFSFNSEATTNAMHSILSNCSLIKKVYLPKYLFPISCVLSSLVNLGFSLVAMFIVMIVTRTPFHATLLLMPIPIFYTFLFSVGLGTMLAALTVYFRDIAHFYGVFILAWTYFTTPNAFLRGQKLETLAQGRLAAYVEEGASLLQYNHLDDGLYLTTHTVPPEKYFVRLNVHLDEMRSELDRAVREAVPDYVLVGWDELPAEFDRYQLIATDVGYDDSNRLNKMLYLYRRKSE